MGKIWEKITEIVGEYSYKLKLYADFQMLQVGLKPSIANMGPDISGSIQIYPDIS